MEWYIILTIAAAGVGLIIGYLLKRKKNYEINQNNIREAQEKLNGIKEEIDNSIQLNQSIQKQFYSTKEALDGLAKSQKELIDRELKIHYDNGLENIKQRLQKADKELSLNYEQNRLKYDNEIKKIQSELNDFKAARRVIINEQKRQEEIETSYLFYTLQISNYDKEDIAQLRIIEPMLHNKEVLNKLIWSTFYQIPYKDLIGRIFGTKKVSGIYKITCNSNKKAYIGKSVDVSNRWSEHIKSSLEIGTIAKNQLYTLMKEKGAEDFTFEVLEEVNKDKLLERESYWIKFFETDSYGLNMKG